MPDDQQFSAQDMSDLKEIAGHLPAGHPMQGKLSKLLNSQPTQFEKDRPGAGTTGEIPKGGYEEPSLLSGAGTAAWEGIKGIGKGIVNSLDPTKGFSGAGLSAVGLNPRSGSVSQRLNEIPIVGAMREARSASQDPNSGFLDKVAAGPGALVGMSDESARGHAARGESGAIVGEAAAPTAMALSPLAAEGVAKGLGATKGYIGKTIVDTSMRPKPLPKFFFGNDRAQALGELMNPEQAAFNQKGEDLMRRGDEQDVLDRRTRQDALQAGRTAPGPWRPGMRPQPELGSPENPGMFSKIPTTMPKVEPELGSPENPGFHAKIPTRMPQPQVTPLSESPNLNINKEKMLSGQSVPLSESPNFNINKQNALTGQSVPLSESPNRGLKPASKPLFGNATATNQVVGNAEVPSFRGPSAPPRSVEYVNKYGSPSSPPTEGLIVRHDSPPPPRKVTYQSAAQPDLLKKVMSGDRDAIAEWDRRSLPRPPGVGFMVEPSAPNIPWGKPR